MADGTVRIDIKADAGDANKTVDGLNSKLSGIEGAGTKGSLGIGKIVTALGLVKIASGAMNLLKSSLDGAISRYDTMNNFPRIMEQLGFSTDESTAAIDKLSKGVSGLPTPLNEIVKSAQGIALMTGDLDGATDTALALNNAFLASGSSAADTSRGMQQYVQMLSRGEVDLMSWRTLQETMGVALNETAKAFGFAGKSAQNDLYDALQDGSVTFDEFNAKIVELDGGVNGFSVRAKTASAGIKTAFSNMRTAVVRGLEGVIRSIDDALASNGLPSIQQMIEAVGTAFETVLSGMAAKFPSIIEGFVNFYNVIQPFLPLIATLAAAFFAYQTVVAATTAINVAIGVYKGLSAAFKGIKLAAEASAVAQRAFNLAMSMNVIGLVVAAIVVLVGVFIYLWKTNEGFRNFFINSWNAIIAFIQPAITAISTIIMNVWNMLVAWWGSNQALFFSTVSVVWNSIKSIFSSVLSLIVGIVQIALDRIKSFWAVWGTTIMSVVKVIWSFISNAFSTTLANILTIVTFSLNLIKSYFQLAMDVIKNIVKVVLSVMKGDWSGALEGIKGIVSAFKTFIIAVFNNVKTTVINLTNTMKTGVINAWNIIKSGVVNAANAVKSGAINAFNNLKSSVVNLANSAKQGAINAWNSLKSSTSNIFNAVVSSIKSILNIDLYQIGKNIIQGLVNGIGSMVKAVANKIQEVASGIKDKITGALGIHSPSRWMRDMVGKNIPRGIAVGIEADTKTATKAMSNMTSQLTMPKLTAESAMGIGNRMSTSPSSLMNTTKNTTVTNDNGMAIHIGNIENNSDSDIPKILEEAAWIMSRDKRRLGYE